MLHAHINPNRFIRLYAPANILFPFCLPVSQLQWHHHCALETKRNMLKIKAVAIILLHNTQYLGLWF